MFAQNLTYFRLKKRLTKHQLAAMINVSDQAIRNYENGRRFPEMSTLKKLASSLGVCVADFISTDNGALTFSHGEIRKQTKCSKMTQKLARAEVENYCHRFFTAVEIVGEKVLPDAFECHVLAVSDSRENDAATLRRYLGFAESGPIAPLVTMLENKGIIVIVADMPDAFPGMNGMVNARPYILLNGTQSPERMRSTAVHELAHLMFRWDGVGEKETEAAATEISGAFLFPREDAIREIGYNRKNISLDLQLVCKEYGISMYMLTKRACLCGIINKRAAQSAYITFGSMGWKHDEPKRIAEEQPHWLKQLVYRAVSMDEISTRRAAELLHIHVCDVEKECGILGLSE